MARRNSTTPLRHLTSIKGGAYTDVAELIRFRHASKEIETVTINKSSNPLSGLLTSKFRGRGIDFAEVRIYEPGDDVRTIDWRVTARTQTPHTKLFQEEKERPVLVLVDQSHSMFFGSRHAFKSVVAAQAAVHVSERLLGQHNGSMLEALKQLDGGTIHLPTRPKDHPDRNRLALRFERFKAAA